MAKKLTDFIGYRIPPFCYNLLFIILGFFYKKPYFWILFIPSISLIYCICNLIFDSYTISIPYSNNDMPTYNELSLAQVIFFPNKNYKIMNKDIYLNESNDRNFYDWTHPQIADSSKLQLNINLYVGNNKKIEFLLIWIYRLGITNKIFSTKEINYFKDNIIRCV